jgi:hypothetical protein
MPFFHCIQDEHKTGKPRNPYIIPIPKYRGDYDWNYVHQLKFASLHYAPYRYKVLEELRKLEIKVTVEDGAIPTGEIILPEGEMPDE